MLMEISCVSLLVGPEMAVGRQLSKVDAFSSNPHDAGETTIATIIRTIPLQSGYWQDRATTDFRHLDPEAVVALLPVAAIEQHGPHLPLSTDAVINDGIVRAALP